MLKSGLHEPGFYAAIWNDLNGKGHWFGELWNRRKNGEVYPEMLTISAVRDDVRNVTLHYVALFTDISAIKEHEKQLEHMLRP
jgi:PAS domain-containing protein